MAVITGHCWSISERMLAGLGQFRVLPFFTAYPKLPQNSNSVIAIAGGYSGRSAKNKEST